VSRQSAHVWRARFTQGGVEALRSRGPTGPDPKLSPADLARVEQALLQGAKANGFDTDLWTLERVAVVICQLTGVRQHPGHVWVILRRRLGWSLQRPSGGPAGATRRRSPAGWPRSGPGAMGGRRRIGLGCRLRPIGPLADRAGASHLVTPGPHPGAAPPLRREARPPGRRLGYRHDHTETMPARLWFHLQQPSDTSDRLIGVLEQLASFGAGQRVVLIWDGLSARWSTRMRAWTDSQRDWLTVGRLSAYGPSSAQWSLCGPTSQLSSWPTSRRPCWPRSPVRTSAHDLRHRG
jgi:transposase